MFLIIWNFGNHDKKHFRESSIYCTQNDFLGNLSFSDVSNISNKGLHTENKIDICDSTPINPLSTTRTFIGPLVVNHEKTSFLDIIN